MKAEARFRKEAEAELKRAKRTARDLWSAERAKWQTRSGPGFVRYTDKPSLSVVARVTERSLTAGAVFADVAAAIKVVAADPQRSPWSIFDEALSQQARREQLLEQAEKLQRERELREPRPQLGLRPVAGAVDQVMRNLGGDGQA